MSRHLLHTFRNWGTAAIDAVLPARCFGCGRLFRPERGAGAAAQDTEGPEGEGRAVLAGFLCGTCNHLIRWIHSPLCTCCGRPFEAPQGVDHPCGTCGEVPAGFARARAAAVYLGAFKALICAYKFQYRTELATPLSRVLWQTLQRYWDLRQIDCIMPVPLHRRRLRGRGFNQADLLIRGLPGTKNSPGRHSMSFEVSADNLVRVRHTPPQIGLDRRQRVVNMMDAFELTDPSEVRGQRILLVDDVLTTGATVNACARVLHRAKAASVEVVTLARAQ